jgi:TetR/AcrR family transcriptional regulator, cholesterol catabolism regulator
LSSSPGPGKAGAILEAFTRHVAQRGYSGTRFSAIAAELGVSQGLIAHHYGTKERLLATLRAQYMANRVDEAKRIVSEFATPSEQLAGLLYASILYQVHDRDRTVAFQREVARFAGEKRESESGKLQTEYVGIVHEVLDAGIASGEFRDVDTNVRTLLIFGAARWAWTWFDPAGPKSAEQIGAELVDLVLGSLLVKRRRLVRLADDQGAVVSTVRKIIAAQYKPGSRWMTQMPP